MAVLANHAGVTRSAVTDAFDGLEASGLASRARDRGDRRIIQARITAAGHGKVDKAIDDFLDVATRIDVGKPEPGPSGPLRATAPIFFNLWTGGANPPGEPRASRLAGTTRPADHH